MSVMTTPFKKVLGIMPKGKERWQRLEITKTEKEAYDMTKICIGGGFNIRCKESFIYYRNNILATHKFSYEFLRFPIVSYKAKYKIFFFLVISRHVLWPFRLLKRPVFKVSGYKSVRFSELFFIKFEKILSFVEV